MYMFVLFIKFCYDATEPPLLQSTNIHDNNKQINFNFAFYWVGG